MKKEDIVALLVLAAIGLFVAVTNIASAYGADSPYPDKLVGREVVDYDFDSEWEENLYDTMENMDEKIPNSIYWGDDEIYYRYGTFYLDNPDRGFFMLPLSFATDWETEIFIRDFTEYLKCGGRDSTFTKDMNDPYGTGPRWSFYLYNKKFYLYYMDM